MIDVIANSKIKLNREKIKKKDYILQFLPESFKSFSKNKNFFFKEKKLKSDYAIDLMHNILLRYYFKKENNLRLNSKILTLKYGHLYNYYVNYFESCGFLKLISNYKVGQKSKSYEISELILNGKILRYQNKDKVLLKKYKKQLISFEEFNIQNSPILEEIRKKLTLDLFSCKVDYQTASIYLNSLNDDVDNLNRNLYALDSIEDGHIFYHFDNFGRMHTNFTILRSYIRKNNLYIDGKQTFEVDIPNSQPLFLIKLIQDSNSVVSKDEFELFKILTKNGNFYQYIVDNSEITSRKEAKKLIYRVLFGKNWRSKENIIFSRIFPSIYNFIKEYKKKSGDYRILSHQLQKMESELIYNKIIKTIMYICPDAKLVTVHDSIISSIDNKEIIETIFRQKLKEEFGI
jgi:hypothetical protein